MAIFKEEGKIIYQAFSKATGITYELETDPYNSNCRIRKIIMSCKCDVVTITLGTEYTLKEKEIIMKAYTNLPEDEFIDLFKRLSLYEILRLADETKSYVGGETREEYSAYVDKFGNLLAVTNYVYHYLHGSSSNYLFVAGSDGFMMELRNFSRYLYKDIRKYQSFINSLNDDSLEKYFQSSYIVKLPN